MLGCGNSSELFSYSLRDRANDLRTALSIDMYNDSFEHIINVDYSPTIIDRMSAAHASTSMKWIVADIKQLPLESSSVDVTIDKGTMDAIMAIEHGDIWNPSEKVIEACRAEVDEALRILKPGGRFIYVTFGQPHFRLPHLKRAGCTVETIELGESFHYYFYVLTKGTTAM